MAHRIPITIKILIAPLFSVIAIAFLAIFSTNTANRTKELTTLSSDASQYLLSIGYLNNSIATAQSDFLLTVSWTMAKMNNKDIAIIQERTLNGLDNSMDKYVELESLVTGAHGNMISPIA
jgi:hypothetical protein